MISPDRREELLSSFWAETNEEWTQEWRDGLMPEEMALVRLWDRCVDDGTARLCQEIVETHKTHV